jgi:hypothetical protein
MIKKLLLTLGLVLFTSQAWATCGAIPLTIKDASNTTQNISSATASDGNCKTYTDWDLGSQAHADATAPIPAGTNTIGAVGFDPSLGAATPTQTFLALPATATTQIIALSGTKLTYVTSRTLLSGGTVNVTFKYGTGTNCGTGTTTLDGPWPLTAQSGFAEGSGNGPVMIVPAGQALCVTTDASVSGGVKLTYQQK